MGGIIAIEASLDESRYAAVRAVNLPDGRTVCTIAFVVDTIGELYDRLAEAAADPTVSADTAVQRHGAPNRFPAVRPGASRLAKHL